ncbi:tetratricopeptide repeat protein [Maioricimonas sp. JC845]|uniref:tetratricopeptide repeat protein n=1 Tax=Maioricimonas sp. JC845 TaxID=3232138 RepID=UPI0034582916
MPFRIRLLTLSVALAGLCAGLLSSQETNADVATAVAGASIEELAGQGELSVDDLTAAIEQARAAGNQEAVASLLNRRGELALGNDDVEAATSDFAASLEAMPDNLPARTGLVECYERLGMHDLADAELTRILRDMEGVSYEADEMLGEFVLPVLDDVAEVVALGIILGGLFLMLLPLNMMLGWRQSREGGGTWLRLIGVSGVYTLFQLAPVIAWLCCRNRAEAIVVFLPVFVLNFTLAVMALGRPVRGPNVKGTLPLVTDEAFLGRVGELSNKLGLRTPRVRMLRTPASTQPAMAWVGGMPAPSLVVTDGILHRLEKDERDFVIGHELAHVVNRSLWFLTGVTPVAAVGAVLATMAVSPITAMLIGWCLRVGLYRIVSRFFEFDCDRRAARVIGYGTAVSALRKIHAAHPLRESGFRSFVIYSTATHPPQVARLDSLWRRAPESEKPERDWSTEKVRWGHRGAVAAVLVWIGVIGTALAVGTHDGFGVVDGLLAVIGTVPFWPALALRPSVKRFQKKVNYSGAGRFGFVFTMILAGVVGIGAAAMIFSDWLDETLFGATVTPLYLVAVVVLIVVTSRDTKFEQELVRLIQDHEFEKAIALAEKHPQTVARKATCRYNVAVAKGISGDRESAIAELKQLCEDEPKMLMAKLTLGAILLDEERPAEALEQAELLEESLADDPEPRLLAGRALRQLGRLDEAEAAAREAMERDEDEGVAWALLAEIAVARGDLEQAAALLQDAERRTPGIPYNQLLRAEMLVAGDDAEAAREAVAAAEQAVAVNPFSVLDGRVRQLNAMYTDRWGDVAIALERSEPDEPLTAGDVEPTGGAFG